MSIYLQHFNLHRPPFDMSPDPVFLYPSPQHAQALANIEFALLNRDSFVIISGDIGMGKTTLLNKVVSELSHDLIAARISHTTLGPIELLQAVLSEFGLHEFDDNKVRLLSQLKRFLEHQYQEDRQVLIMVDEAQNLTLETLEELRLVSGIELNSTKLVSIVLAGQPELNDLIDSPRLTQLRQRARLRQHISPLSKAETREYLRTRLEIAGGSIDDIFSSGSVDTVFEAAGGVPRLINTLCDTVLTGCAVENAKTVNKRMVQRVVRELGWGDDPNSPHLIATPGTSSTATSAAPYVQSQRTDEQTDQGVHGWLVSVRRKGKELKIPITQLPFILGRSERNNYQLRNPDVSRRHVIIHADNGNLLIEDLNSANGTLLNGTRIKTGHLHPGDMVRLGSMLFQFRETPDELLSNVDDEDSGTHRQDSIKDVAGAPALGEAENGARDARGRFVSNVKRGRRKRG